MRKLLNTLYITTPNSYLSLDGENIVVLLDNYEKFRMPFVNIENIVCFGYMGASPALMGKCVNNNVGLCFLKPNGEFLARIIGKTKGNVLLRTRQYRMSEDEQFCLNFSINIVSAKIYNTKATLQRTIRDRSNTIDVSCLEDTVEFLEKNIGKVYEFLDLDQLRGFEGINARNYFEVFNDMIICQKDDFKMKVRTKRPPLDYLNCLLSYLYTILSLEVGAALESIGFDPYVGFMHTLRPGRASLALDMMEELRAYMVDRHVITMINLKQITKKDFRKKEGGAILMTDEGRKKLLTIWQERKKEIIVHPYLNEKVEIGLIPYVQAQLLSKFLRGDLYEYNPFLIK
jgi:CRISPR-associated protein Cas1